MSVISFAVLLILILMILASSLRILNEYERGVIFRLGRVRTVGGKPAAKGPGLIFLIPVVDKLVKVSLRTVTMDVPPQDVITRDNISIKVNAVIYFRVMDPNKAILEIENYLYG
ncbi:MAG: rane protease subunit, stomatin/prohibitin -like protein, partial [Deltaproteobacteria bacterium]|nr:rane protease subunit, stomatin/prohibitin -like protein [Deltaproteobacteria bacterium]